MQTIYCVLGRTSCGKSTITNLAAQKLHMKVLKSFTTRTRRKNETDEKSDHIFIQVKDVDLYKKDIVAYTERVGYCNFATKQQLLNSDFYVINPSEYQNLIPIAKDLDVELVLIFITSPYYIITERAKKRGHFESWKENYEKEKEEFSLFEKTNLIDYRILNDGPINDAVDKMVNIITKHKRKSTNGKK